MIEIKNLFKQFNEKLLFEDLNETIQSGEYIVFSGESGTGKTTLLNMIGYLEPVTSGSIIIDHIDYQKSNQLIDFYRRKIGFLFQNFGLVENKTVKENLELVKKPSRTETSIEEALKIVGLSDKLNETVYKLSGGEQQRVALARLMVKKCDIILADEPTGSLDKRNANIVLGILEELHHLGKTIIVVSHDEDVKKRAERIIELKK